MKIISVKFLKHPLFTDTIFDFRKEDGSISRTVVIAGNNALGKSMLLETLTFTLTRLKETQSPHVTVFELELSDQEFSTLVHGVLKPDQVHLYKKDRITVTASSSVSGGISRSEYEIALHNQTGGKDIFTGLTEGFEKIKKIAYLPFEKGESDAGIPDAGSIELHDLGKIEVLRTRFDEWFPYTKDYPIADKIYDYVGMTDSKPLLPIGDLSAGQKQVLNIRDFLLHKAYARDNSIVVMDEPEARLHTDWQKRIVGFFDEVFREDHGVNFRQLIMVTHSPYFFQRYLERDAAIFIFCRNKEGKLAILTSKDIFGWPIGKVLQQTYDTEIFITDRKALFVEGETDEIYLSKCLEVFNMYNFPYRIKWIGKHGNNKGGTISAGKSGLDHFMTFLLANEELTPFPVMLLYDNDANKQKDYYNNVSVEVLPFNPLNEIFKIGIENLLVLPNEFSAEPFYDQHIKVDKYSARSTIRTLNKLRLCHHICGLPDVILKTVFQKMHEFLLSIK